MLEKPEDIFKDPYILEFTGLPEMVTYSETELENQIIDNSEVPIRIRERIYFCR